MHWQLIFVVQVRLRQKYYAYFSRKMGWFVVSVHCMLSPVAQCVARRAPMVTGSRPVLVIAWGWHIGLALLCGCSGALEYPTTNSCGPINKSFLPSFLMYSVFNTKSISQKAIVRRQFLLIDILCIIIKDFISLLLNMLQHHTWWNFDWECRWRWVLLRTICN